MTNAPSGRVSGLVNNKLSRGFPIVGDSPSTDWFHCSPDVRGGGGGGAPWDEPAPNLTEPSTLMLVRQVADTTVLMVVRWWGATTSGCEEAPAEHGGGLSRLAVAMGEYKAGGDQRSFLLLAPDVMSEAAKQAATVARCLSKQMQVTPSVHFLTLSGN